MTTHSVTLGKRRSFVSAGAALMAKAWQVWRAIAARRQVMTLLDADDHMLADIGLTRADVIGSLEAPLDVDPSHQLIRARAERMGGRARFWKAV